MECGLDWIVLDWIGVVRYWRIRNVDVVGDDRLRRIKRLYGGVGIG